MKNQKLTTSYVRSFYNKFVSSLGQDYTQWRWFQNKVTLLQYRQTKKTILRCLGNNKFTNCLEIGCGDGAWTPLFSQICRSVTAIDISPEMTKRAKKKLAGYRNINTITGNFLENQLPSNHYDLLTAIRSIEYIKDKRMMILKAYRLLRKGGHFLIITKNPKYSKASSRSKELIHSGEIDILLLKEMLASRGFRIEAIYPAIIGRFLFFTPAWVFFNFLHSFFLQTGAAVFPAVITQHFIESYAIVGQKQ